MIELEKMESVMKFMIKMSSILLWNFLFAGEGIAQDSTLFVDISSEMIVPRHCILIKTNQPIIIDGKADEVAWQKAPFTASFIDIEGKKIPKFDTQAKMLWDDRFLYIFAHLQEPHIWGSLVQRDTVIFYNNDFEVFIDPSGTTKNYGEIEINALGTVWDLLLDKPYRVGGKANNHWHLDSLKSAVFIDGTLNKPGDHDKGWSVELAVPLSALIELKSKPRHRPREGELWRLNFSRVEWDFDLIDGQYRRKKLAGKFLPEYNWVWSNQQVVDMHQPEKWGFVQFTEKSDADRVVFHQPVDFAIRQAAFALFRMARFGSLKYLTDLQPYQMRKLSVKISAQERLDAAFTRTHFGFEIRVMELNSNVMIIIDEEGVTKRN